MMKSPVNWRHDALKFKNFLSLKKKTEDKIRIQMPDFKIPPELMVSKPPLESWSLSHIFRSLTSVDWKLLLDFHRISNHIRNWHTTHFISISVYIYTCNFFFFVRSWMEYPWRIINYARHKHTERDRETHRKFVYIAHFW